MIECITEEFNEKNTLFEKTYMSQYGKNNQIKL